MAAGTRLWNVSNPTLRLFTLNIGGPSVERAARLADYLSAQDADMLVLTETRGNAGTSALLDALADAGYLAQWPYPPSAGERGVAVLSRFHSSSAVKEVADLSHRLVVEAVDLGDPLTLIAAYVPSRDASPGKIERKKRFLAQFLNVLEEPAHLQGTIVMGDFNVVSYDHIPKYSVFRHWEYESLERIEELGFVDAFASLHPGEQAHSWIGRTGSGYRYDYAFVSPDLATSVIDCEYLHDPREARLSDHAGVLLTLGHPTERKVALAS